MTLTALSNKSEIQAAYLDLKKALTKGIKPVERNVGWHGGGGTFSVYWDSTEKFWCLLKPSLVKNRYWCALAWTTLTNGTI
jgi:hypothetical protein